MLHRRRPVALLVGLLALTPACKKTEATAAPEPAPAAQADAEAPAEPAASEEEESPYLDVMNFNRTVEGHLAEIDACYRETAAKEPGPPTGRVKTTIVVDGDGKVKKVSFDDQRSTLKHAGLNACIESKAKAWRFNITLNGTDTPMPYTFTLQ